MRTIQTLLGWLGLAAAAAVSAADFPEPYNSEKDPSKPVALADATKGIKLPEGFSATLFAGEPDVQNPIGCAWDSRGRLWIAENYTYAERGKKFELALRDRVVILEDTDNDGKSDKRTVFTDNVQMLAGIEVGLGGVWLMCPPQVLFVPDANRDDVPDGPPQVILDGFDPPPENYHNFANGLKFGPDGWLYGRCGASAPGKIGIPGTPAKDRIPMLGGMFRYHPQTKQIDVLCQGTTNPWGHDWSPTGELFFINTVNGHLWHVIPGAHFVRPHTIDPNPYAYEAIDQHADHFHFDTGKGWMASRDGKANDLGGGHAHCGLMIYQGDNWPEQYRGKLFTLNFHGRRINVENLEREGAGYVGKHGPDMVLWEDKWFRGMDLTTGPDGSVFVLDWSDAGECHDHTGVHRQSGRIFKISYGTPKKPEVKDVHALNDDQLAGLHTHSNDWYARQARVELMERAAAKINPDGGTAKLIEILKGGKPAEKLRALWTIIAANKNIDRGLLGDLWLSPDENIRGWMLRVTVDNLALDTALSVRPTGSQEPAEGIVTTLKTLAENDASGIVHLTLASVLQRLPFKDRAGIAMALVKRAEHANDHNLPLMVWYGLIPVADIDPMGLAKIGVACQWPLTRQLIARRLGESIEKNGDAVNLLVETAASKDDVFAKDILTGLSKGFAAKRKAPKPAAWDKLAAKVDGGANEELKATSRDLAVLFGDGRALDAVKALVTNGKTELATRKSALLTLIDSRPDDLRAICEGLLKTRFMNGVAVKGLVLFDDPEVGKKIAQAYKSFHPSERHLAIDALVSRPSFALALCEELSAKRIERGDISPFQARQIQSLGDKAVSEKFAAAWGEMRESDEEKKKAIADLKAKLTPDVIAKGDRSAGRATFAKLCITCHTLYGEGGKIGPDLTGAGRDNLDYVVDNIVDPSAVVSADFRMSVVVLNDGRVLNGIVTKQTKEALTLQTQTEVLTINMADVKRSKASDLSLMPDGLTESLKPEEIRDLVSYLMTRTQVPLPGEKK